MKSYKDPEIYKLAYQQAMEIHDLSLTLPKFELYEQGSQIRRSSKSLKDNIAEGYGRKRYKDDFIKYLTCTQASCDEVTAQLNMINDLYFKEKTLTELMENHDILGKKINKFIQYVEENRNK
jgi:four helix bundle protein